MQICPNCAKELDDRDIICAFCGHTGGAASRTLAPPVTIVDSPIAGLAIVPRVGAVKPKNASHNAILVSAVIGAVTAVMFAVRSPRGNAQANAAVAPPA